MSGDVDPESTAERSSGFQDNASLGQSVLLILAAAAVVVIAAVLISVLLL